MVGNGTVDAKAFVLSEEVKRSTGGGIATNALRG
jgi:hypothetical protein